MRGLVELEKLYSINQHSTHLKEHLLFALCSLQSRCSEKHKDQKGMDPCPENLKCRIGDKEQLTLKQSLEVMHGLRGSDNLPGISKEIKWELEECNKDKKF